MSWPPEFQKQVEWRLCLEKNSMRLYVLILGPCSGWTLLEEAAGQLGVKQAARWEVDAELEALQSSVAQFCDLVLEMADEMSSLVASLSSVVELPEDHIDAMIANDVCWGTRSTLAATLSHFLELGTKLELLGSGYNADLTKDQVDAIWTQECPASDSLVSYVPPLVARNPPNGAAGGGVE
jgi:hypothetical protein